MIRDSNIFNLMLKQKCLISAEDGGNTLGGINLMVVWFWRNHNFIAKQLAAVNPCWDDDKLFNVTRDINIALSLQLYYYELLPLYMGEYSLSAFLRFCLPGTNTTRESRQSDILSAILS